MGKVTFKEFKKEFTERCKKASACSTEFKKVLQAETIEDLLEIIINNFGWCRDNVFDKEFLEKYSTILNNGKDNSGIGNSGYRNSGDQNSGYRNSGYRNSGDQNSGDLNSGDRNSGYLNSGDLNSGYRNSGDLNSGYRNSGDLNSGYRNSGVFSNKKRKDKVIFFNQESNMTWDEWYNHKAHGLCHNLKITEWINWDSMSSDEKKNNKSAFVCGGCVKTYDYKDAWKNLWDTFTDEQKIWFKELPNFDSNIFEDITGIKNN